MKALTTQKNIMISNYIHCHRGSTEDVRGITRRGDGRARLAGVGHVPIAAEFRSECGSTGRDAAPQAGPRTSAGQVSAAAIPRLRQLPQRRGKPPRLRRPPRRLVPHREALRDELLGLPGDHHQNIRRLSLCLTKRTVSFPPYRRSDLR